MKLILIILLSLSFSCSKKSSSSIKRETPINQEEIDVVMANQRFACAPIKGTECPHGVARLLIVNPKIPEQSAVCSGFMISPNRLVTNYHCVNTQEFCNSTYIAIYNGPTYMSTRCKTIVKAEQDVEDPNDPTRAIDLAILETVDFFPGHTFPLSQSLANTGDVVHAWVIDHTGLDSFPPNLLDSRVTELECPVIDQSLRASLVMRPCAIISGNSGSPGLNEQGEVVGVFWGGTAVSPVDASLDLSIRRTLDELGLLTEVNYLRE